MRTVGSCYLIQDRCLTLLLPLCTYRFEQSQNGIYRRKCGMGKDHRDWCRYTHASHVQSITLGELDPTRTDSTSIGIMVASRLLAYSECLVGRNGTGSSTIPRQAIEKMSGLLQAPTSVKTSPPTGFGLSKGWNQNGMDGRD